MICAIKTKYKREDGYFEEDLLQSSMHHLHAASLLFQRGPDLYDSGGYLVHLSIELLLKSWLLSLTGEFPGTHNLQDLRQKIAVVTADIKLTKEQNKTIELINRLYELRYPNRRTPTEVGSETFKLVFQLYEVLEVRLPNDLKQKLASLPHEKKGGRQLMKKLASIPADLKLLLNKPTERVSRPTRKTRT